MSRTGQTADGEKRSVHLSEAVGMWPTPNVPNGGRAMAEEDVAAKGATDKGKRQVPLGSAAQLWPTPTAEMFQDGESPETWLARRERLKETAQNGNGCGTPLTMAVQMWPTPASIDGQKAPKQYAGGNPSLPAMATGNWSTPRANERHQHNSQDDHVALSLQVDLWATPSTRDHRSGLASMETLERNSRPLSEQVESMWATPNSKCSEDSQTHRSGGRSEELLLTGQAQQWATPKAVDGFKPSAGVRRTSDLSHQVQATPDGPTSSPSPRGSRPQLNAAFVCWMMNWPWWWTHPEWINSDAQAMEWWFARQRSLLDSLLGEEG